MQYDFTSILDRHGRDSIAVDGLGRSPGFAPDAPQPGFDDGGYPPMPVPSCWRDQRSCSRSSSSWRISWRRLRAPSSW